MKVPCVLHMDSIIGSHIGLKGLLQRYWIFYIGKHMLVTLRKNGKRGTRGNLKKSAQDLII